MNLEKLVTMPNAVQFGHLRALVGSSGIIKVRNVNLSNLVSSDYPKSNYLLKFAITGELKVCNTPLPQSEPERD